jgi:hypothetical protein
LPFFNDHFGYRGFSLKKEERWKHINLHQSFFTADDKPVKLIKDYNAVYPGYSQNIGKALENAIDEAG